MVWFRSGRENGKYNITESSKENENIYIFIRNFDAVLFNENYIVENSE